MVERANHPEQIGPSNILPSHCRYQNRCIMLITEIHRIHWQHRKTSRRLTDTVTSSQHKNLASTTLQLANEDTVSRPFEKLILNYDTGPA